MLLRSLLIALFRNTKLVSQNLTNGIPNEPARPRSPRVWRLGVPGSGENMPFSSSGPQVQMPFLISQWRAEVRAWRVSFSIRSAFLIVCSLKDAWNRIMRFNQMSSYSASQRFSLKGQQPSPNTHPLASDHGTNSWVSGEPHPSSRIPSRRAFADVSSVKSRVIAG